MIRLYFSKKKKRVITRWIAGAEEISRLAGGWQVEFLGSGLVVLQIFGLVHSGFHGSSAGLAYMEKYPQYPYQNSRQIGLSE